MELDIHELFKVWRQLNGWDQAELASRAGIDTSVISNIETMKRKPSYDTLEKVVRALEVTFSEFYSLPDLSAFGTEVFPENPSQTFHNVIRARQENHLTELPFMSDEDLTQLIRIVKLTLEDNPPLQKKSNIEETKESDSD